MSNPSISVCIPTYNGTAYLHACLDSLLAQTFADFEVIVVDDHSSDTSFAIAEQYAVRDNRIRVHRNAHNLGLVGNWNRCVELAQGAWIKFLFHDDLLAPTCLQRMFDAAQSGASSLVTCRRELIFAPDVDPTFADEVRNIPTMDTVFGDRRYISAADFCQAVLDHFCVNMIGEPTVIMLRRDVFQRYGHFNADLIQICDLEYWIRIAIHEGITYVPETLASFRVHNSATSAANRAKKRFRMEVLDALLLLHECAYNRHYAPLRNAARQRKLNLKKWLAKDALEARYIAESWSVKEPGLLADWKALATKYPRLQFNFWGYVQRGRQKLFGRSV